MYGPIGNRWPGDWSSTVHSHEAKCFRFKIGHYNHPKVSGAMTVGIDAHHNIEAGFKIHSLHLDNSEPLVDSAIFVASRHNTNYFIKRSTTW